MEFFVGILTGAIGTVTLKKFFRPLAKGAIKGSVHLARKVQEIQTEAAEDLADIKAEAMAEIRANDEKHGLSTSDDVIRKA